MAGGVPRAGHRQPGGRGEPDRRLGARRCTQHDRCRPTRTGRLIGPHRRGRPAALEVEDLEVAYRVRGVPRRGAARGVSFAGGSGRGLRAGGRVGLRQVDHRVRRAALPADQRPHHRWARCWSTGSRRDLAMSNVRAAPLCGCRRRFDGVPGPGFGAEPGAADRPPGGRVLLAARCHSKSEATDEGGRGPAPGAHRRSPGCVMDRYPHQLSGGMQQRVVIAMALANNPKLLVLDEPTTGLDATVEAEVLDLVRTLRAETDAAILLIAHNLGVIRTDVRPGRRDVRRPGDRGGRRRPRCSTIRQHPYTVGLLNVPAPSRASARASSCCSTIPGTLPQIGTPLPTCVFVDRCPPGQRHLPYRGPTPWWNSAPGRWALLPPRRPGVDTMARHRTDRRDVGGSDWGPAGWCWRCVEVSKTFKPAAVTTVPALVGGGSRAWRRGRPWAWWASPVRASRRWPRP